jgi:hypothetical protein
MWNVCFLSYIEIKVPSMNTLYSLNSPNLTQMYHILEQVDNLFNLFGTAAKYSAPLFSTILPILDRSSGSGSGFGFLDISSFWNLDETSLRGLDQWPSPLPLQ